MEFPWNIPRRLSGYFHHLHSTTPCCLWRFLPFVSIVLANPDGVWRGPTGMGVDKGGATEEIDTKCQGEGYQRVDDV